MNQQNIKGNIHTHHVGEGVAAAAIPAQVLLEVVLAGILGRAQEQHVLVKVGQSRPVRRILKVSRIDVDGTGLDVRGGVGHEEDRQAVGEGDGAVLPGVGLGLEEGGVGGDYLRLLLLGSRRRNRRTAIGFADGRNCRSQGKRRRCWG